MLFTTNYTDAAQILGNQTGTKDVAYMPAGIHENVKLTNIRIDKTKNGLNFIEYTFKDLDGNMCKHTEFEPTKRIGEDELTFQRRVENLMRRMLQVIRIYTSENFEAASFNDMAELIKAKLDAVKDNILVRIKVVYQWSEDKKTDFTRLPMYWMYTFIEPMSIPTNKSTIRILTMDKIQREYVPDTEKNTPNVLQKEEPTVKQTKEDELPF
jgi:hypothetical protein